MNLLIENWQSTTTHQYLLSIQLLQSITQGNQLNSGHLNVIFTTNLTTRDTTMTPQMYENCSCGLSSCRKALGIYSHNSSTDEFILLFEIPNFYTC